MIASILGSPYTTADAVVIGIPYEKTASFGDGAKLGPERIKNVLDEQIELFDRYTKTSPAELYNFGFTSLDQVNEMSPEQMVKEVSEFLKEESRFYLLTGGEHSITIPSVQSLAEKVNPEEVTIVQIDAHFDLRDDDSEYNEIDPSKFAHSTVMRRAHELGFNILPIGIRTMYEKEYEYVQKHNIKYFEWGKSGQKIPSIDEIIEAIPTEKVYLTIDVDGFDPSVMPGTGTPVPGGLTWEYGEDLIRSIMTKKDVLAADIAEVSPQSHTGQTEYNAGQLAYHILSISAKKSSNK